MSELGHNTAKALEMLAKACKTEVVLCGDDPRFAMQVETALEYEALYRYALRCVRAVEAMESLKINLSPLTAGWEGGCAGKNYSGSTALELIELAASDAPRG